MKTNFEKAKRIIEGQTKLMLEDKIDAEFIKDFNSMTIKKLSDKLNLTTEEITKLKALWY